MVGIKSSKSVLDRDILKQIFHFSNLEYLQQPFNLKYVTLSEITVIITWSMTRQSLVFFREQRDTPLIFLKS